MTHTPSDKRHRRHTRPDKPARKTKRLSFPALISLSLLMLVSLGVFINARLKLLAIPLERDEGSFAYIGHWMLKGKQLYVDMVDSKLPGLYWIYAAFTSVFGYNPEGVHTSLIAMNALSAIALFLLVRKLYTTSIAAWSTAIFLVMTLSTNMQGFAAHATQLLTPFVLWGFWLYWKGIDSRKWWWFFAAGLSIGLAVTVKQQSAIFGLLLAGLWWPLRTVWNKAKDQKLPIREWLALGVGGFLPVAAICGYFLAVGRFDVFYTWTVSHPLVLSGAYLLPWYEMLGNILPAVLTKFEPIWILGLAGLPLLFFSGFKKGRNWFGLLYFLLAALSVAVGTAYYKHYFVLMIPALAICAAVAVHWASNKLGNYWGPVAGTAVIAGLLVWPVLGRKDYFFQPDYKKIHFENYGNNMFPELEEIAKFLKQDLAEGEEIGVLGSEPEFLVAAECPSCTRHIMTYSMLIHPEISPPLQQEYIEELKACSPRFLVWNVVSGSWTKGYEQLQFWKEIRAWLDENYRIVGLAESFEGGESRVLFGGSIVNHELESTNIVFVYKRKVKAAPEVRTLEDDAE